MERSIVQDFIRACQTSKRADFCRQLEAPVLIAESPKAGLSFGQSSTTLKRVQKEAPLARDLIRRGHQLPVLLIRQRLPGPRGHVRVGRSRENDLVIADETVSSRHAVLQMNEKTSTFTVQDVASMNGTRVNGTRLVVGKSVVLFDGDVLAFGDAMFLFFYPEGLYDVLKANLKSL